MHRRFFPTYVLHWALVWSLAIAGCGTRSTSKNQPVTNGVPHPPTASIALFQEIEDPGGTSTKKEIWPAGRGFLPDLNPGGVALIDCQNDGRLSIVQVCHPPPGNSTAPSPCRLFRQQPNGTFMMAPGAGGLDNTAFGQGIAVGDYDNDGFPDVYFCNYGIDELYHNNGDGTFTNVSLKAGISREPNWSTSASFFDYDRDGYLDLIVLHYVKFDYSVVCNALGERQYCKPEYFQGLRAALYHNNRNGTFTDVTEKAGLIAPGRGLGVICADLTGDGWPDIFVANDGQPNYLWVNRHDGTFGEEGIERGCAFNGMGQTEANMGVALGDTRGNGLLDLFVTHQIREKNTMFRADALNHFRDASADASMMPNGPTGWGTGFIDLDNSGVLSLALVNGRIWPDAVIPGADRGPFWNRYAERNTLLKNDGAGHFTDISGLGGDFTRQIEVTRGLAFGDLDNDGRIDLVTNTVDNVLRVYHNIADTAGNHWLTVRVLTGKRDALGAELSLEAGGHRLVRLAITGYSSSSSSDPRVHFGLGKATTDAIDVRWPGGRRERFTVDGVDRQMTIREGQGKPIEEPATPPR